MKEIKLISVITCPHCGHKSRETMPEGACQFFYECKGCKKLIKSPNGDCCVFCAYGDIPCPAVQRGEKCCKKVNS